MWSFIFFIACVVAVMAVVYYKFDGWSDDDDKDY